MEARLQPGKYSAASVVVQKFAHSRDESFKRISEPNDTRIIGLLASYESEVRIRGVLQGVCELRIRDTSGRSRRARPDYPPGFSRAWRGPAPTPPGGRAGRRRSASACRA